MEKIKIFLFLLVLLFLDFLRPWGNILYTEFLLLGIIFISLEDTSFFSFYMSLFFGMLKDFFSLSFPLYTFIFLLLNRVFAHLKKYFSSYRFFEFFSLGAVFIFYIFINNFLQKFFSIKFSLLFLFHSFFLFLLLEKIFKRCLQKSS
ncbi:MAG: hypothetical protein B6D55_05900 [Candidatus Omnitrophica bacterium 4484_70.2]|nr:MAG: hypothetical protein B6D55_05900 [Candidatus Omnitrophica bacterium 4484_70.2]